RSLTLGLCDRGVLTAISNLSSLRSLSCSLTDASDAASLPKFAELRRLEIDDRGAPHSARNTPLDLRALNLCGELKELVVVGSCLLPSGSKIESLSATKIQLNDMAQIAFFPMLRELYLNISLVETA